MIIWILIAIVILSLGHLGIYAFFVSIFPIFSASHVWAIRLMFLLLSLSFVVSLIISHQYDSFLTQFLYKISATWVGFLFYFFLASVIYSVILFILHFIPFNFSGILIGRILFTLAILVGIYGIYNANNISVTERTVTIPNLPIDWKGKRAVFYSDIHLGQINNLGFAERISKKIKELNPDIIFNGGDLYDGVKVDAEKVIAPLAELKPPMGHYFVTGNHESFGNTLQYEKSILNTGIIKLDNSAVEVSGVEIIGAGYEKTRKTEDLETFLKNIHKNKKIPAILIKHVPFDLDIAEKEGISLQISGHTHRAQMWPLSYVTEYIYKGYDYGLKNFEAMQVLVSDGVGTWGPPMRVGTRSEIVLIKFQ